jgi:two-component system sensor histidine kinase CpxA
MLGYLTVGISIYESSGSTATNQWLSYLRDQDDISAYFLVKNKGILGKKPVPKEIQKIYSELKNNTLTTSATKEGIYLISTQKDGRSEFKNYRLIVDSYSLAHSNYGFLSIISRFSVVLLISSFCCLFVTYILIRPILSIKNAVSDITKGKLNTRIGGQYKYRQDELSELARDLDKMAETLLGLIASKERLLEDVSHELRAPLSRQQVAIELLKANSSGLSIRHYNRIQHENIKLNKLIDEIIELSKINTHARKLNVETFNLTKLVGNIAEDANFEIQCNCIKVDARENIKINADKLLINRSIENLVRNAIRYTTQDKKILLSLALNAQEISFCISDNGPGVPDADLEFIFDVFYRGVQARKQNIPGYGIGLAITKRAISLHGGSIKAENKNDGGLKVTITLPISLKNL